MATLIKLPKGVVNSKGKRHYALWKTVFEVDSKYVLIKPLGRGTCGVVCSALNMETNEKVAIKKIDKIFENPIDAVRTLREMKLLRHIQHENVIALKDVMMPSRQRSFRDVYLVYELMDTDLHHTIKSPLPLSKDHCKYFLFQLLQGLNHLHSANILHRDLKPENLLVNANCDLKICDFGLARTCKDNGESMTEYVVTRWYRAPELLLCARKYGTSIDMWSVGCIFAELLGRKPIFPGTDHFNQIRQILRIVGTPEEDDLEFIDNPRSRKYVESLPFFGGVSYYDVCPEADPLAIELLVKMLQFNPAKRITAAEALQHPYLSDLYDPSCNLPAQVRMDLDVDEDLDTQKMREMMWAEILLHQHPEAAS